jgi:hypothetical protein
MTAPRRLDIAFLAAATFIALVLRGWGLGLLGLVHFDEGIYAMAGLGLGASALPKFDPSWIAYAPPGFPLLVGLAFRVLGPSDVAAIGVSVLLGAATVPLLGVLAGRAFGREAGAWATMFALLWGAHVAFSRMALTDATYLFAWTLALLASARLLERPAPGRVIAAGLAIGLAMNAKYNGWLAGVVLVLAAVSSRAERSWKPWGAFVLALIVAGLAYAPWYLFVERHGGYGSLLRHQSGYVLGVNAWWPDLQVQLAQVVALSGLPGWTVVLQVPCAVALSLVALSSRRPLPAWLRSAWNVLAALALLLAPSLVWLMALTRVPTGLVDERPAARLASWSWVVLTILTPLYHPYARLWLPLHAISLVLVCGWLTGLGRTTDRRATLWQGAVATMALLWAIVIPSGRPLPGLLGPSDSLRSACLEAADLLKDAPTPVPVLARPSALFYLGRRVEVSRFADSRPVATYFGPSPWLLIDEAQWHQDGMPEDVLRRVHSRWEVARRWPVPLNAPTLLDIDPAAASDPTRAIPVDLVLYRRRSTEGPP